MSNRFRLFIAAALAALVAPAAMAATISLTADSGWKRSTSGTNVQRRVMTVFYDDAAVGLNTYTFALGSSSAVLERVIVQSTACVDCDLIVRTGTTAGYGVLYARNDFDTLTAAADQIEGVAFTQYGNDQPETGCASATPAAVLDNNDGVTRDVTVTFVWRAD